MISTFLIFALKIVLGALLTSVILCEWSDSFKDCFMNVTVRFVLIIASLLFLYYAPLLAAIPLISQAIILALTTATSFVIYKHVLMKQFTIPKYLKNLPEVKQDSLRFKN